MVIGARTAAWGGDKKIHGFIANGLFAYYDGIDNVGLGDDNHATSLTNWVNLVGDVDLTPNNSSGHTWFIGNDYIGMGHTGRYYVSGCATFPTYRGPLTIEYDIYLRLWIAQQAIVDFRESSSASRFSVLTHYSWQQGTDFFYSFGGISGQTLSLQNSIPNLDTWYRFSIVLTDTSTKVYRDGVLLGEKSISISYTDLSYLVLNRYGSNNSSSASYRSLRIYNRALRDSEIIANYNNERERFG